jgi:hypothetical protein
LKRKRQAEIFGRSSFQWKGSSELKPGTANRFGRAQDEEEIREVFTVNGGGKKIHPETVNSNIDVRKLNT